MDEFQSSTYGHGSSTSLSYETWADLFSLEISVLLCSLLVKELLLYIYLSQLMSTFTNYLKVHCPLDGFFIQKVKELVIQQSHIYLCIHWLVIEEYIGEITFQLSFVHSCHFPVRWAYPNVNQHFSSYSRSECLSVCPVLI